MVSSNRKILARSMEDSVDSSGNNHWLEGRQASWQKSDRVTSTLRSVRRNPEICRRSAFPTAALLRFLLDEETLLLQLTMQALLLPHSLLLPATTSAAVSP